MISLPTSCGEQSWLCTVLLTPLRALQGCSAQLLSTITLVGLAAPLLQSLRLTFSQNSAAHGGVGMLSAAGIGPLTVLRQLRSLTIRDLETFDPCLANTLRRLTALTSLCLATSPYSQSTDSEGFVVPSGLAKLAVVSVVDQRRAVAANLTCALPRSLTQLRQVEVHNMRMAISDSVLESLTALESLMLLHERPLAANSRPHPVNALLGGISALNSLTQLRVSCNYQHLPPLLQPALQVLQLDAPPSGDEV